MATASPGHGQQYVNSVVMGGSYPPRPKYEKGDVQQATNLRNWQMRQIPYLHPYRLRLARSWRRADLFKQQVQWLRLSYNLDSTGTMHYAPIEFDDNDDDAIPIPVLDHFSAPIDNEASRLGKPEYEPYARYDEGADLKTRTAAKLSQQILQSELDRMRWGDTCELANLHLPLYGQAILVSEWETNYSDTTMYPKQGMLRCPNCDFKAASPSISREEAESMPPDAYTEGGETEVPQLTACPTCEEHEETEVVDSTDPFSGLVIPMEQQVMRPGGPQLQPWSDPSAEDLAGQDHFGRPLGDAIPNGQWNLRLVSPYDAFPYNLGVDETNASLDSISFVEVKPLSWFTKHFENGYLVKREAPAEIMRYNPICGERALFYGNTALVGTADGLFQNHCRLRTTYIKPWREKVVDDDGKPVIDPATGEPLLEMNHGQCIKMAGDVLLVDGDYEIQSQRTPGEWFPRAIWECVVWGYRSGGREWWGNGMAERLFDACENINELFSQIKDARETHGSPKWLVPKGLEFDFNDAAEAGVQWIYEYDPLRPELQPREVGNTLLNVEVYKELEAMGTFIDMASYNSQVEQGNVPPGVAAALAIQMLAEQTNEQRRPRIKRVREALERLWSHGMKLNHELVLDSRVFWKQPDGPGEWSQDAWSGESVGGMTDIHIKAEPEHDSEIQKQQLVRDLIEAGLFDLNDPRVRRIVAREMGASQDLFDQQDRQEKWAETEYINFRDNGQAPVVEEEMDDDQIHYDRHTFDAKSEWARDKERQARWFEALPYLAGWNQPMGPPITLGIDMMTGQPITQPQPSPFEQFISTIGASLPDSYEIRLATCWHTMLQQIGWAPQTPEEADALDWVIRFRAHIASHKINATRDLAAAQAGIPVMQPGGAPSTNQGAIGPGTIGSPMAQGGPRQVQIPGSTMPVPATPAGAPAAPAMQ